MRSGFLYDYISDQRRGCVRKFLILLLFILTGCFKVGPNFHDPATPMQQEWMECGEMEVDCGEKVITEWWSVFNDPKLTELIDVAQCQNLDLKIAAFRVIASRYLFAIAVGEWFPQLQDLVGDATRTEISKNAPNTVFADRVFWDFNIGLLASWEIDFWGKFRRGIEAANDDLWASYYNYNDVLVILLADVASTYVTIRTLEERIEIVKHNIAIQTRSLEIVEARWQAGVVTELDVQQARTLLTATQSRFPLLEADLRAAKNALSILLGVTPEDLTCYLDEPGQIPESPPVVGVGIPAEILCRRPDVRQALYEAAAQSARIGIATADLYPAISITGFIGFESSADTMMTALGGGGSLFSSDSLTYIFSPNFAWKVFNYGRLKNRVNFEYATFCQFILNYQNTVILAYSEVEDGLISYVKTQDQAHFLAESVASAKRAAEVARTQYVEGLADYTRVLETDRSLVDQQEQYAISRGSIVQALISTYRALGGGWQSCPLD